MINAAVKTAVNYWSIKFFIYWIDLKSSQITEIKSVFK